MNDILPGLSNIPLHPLLVHAPVVLWPLATLAFVVDALRPDPDLARAGRWLLALGTVAGAAAIASGLFAADALGHDSPGHELVHVHRNFMGTAFAMAFVATAVSVAWHPYRTKVARSLLAAWLVLTSLVMVLGADRGAALVYRYGTGVQDTPPASTGGHEHGGGGHEHGGGGHEHGGDEAPAHGH